MLHNLNNKFKKKKSYIVYCKCKYEFLKLKEKNIPIRKE